LDSLPEGCDWGHSGYLGEPILPFLPTGKQNFYDPQQRNWATELRLLVANPIPHHLNWWPLMSSNARYASLKDNKRRCLETPERKIPALALSSTRLLLAAI
jgi:hypothetical protein